MDDSNGVDKSKRATLRQFAGLAALSPLVHLTNVDTESATPDAIAGYLFTTPGAHFSKIRDDLKLGTGETQHHLRTLLQDGVIESHRDGEYRRFFPNGRFTAFERMALGYLRRETPRGMIVSLLREPGTSASELADSLDVSAPTVSNHAARMDDAGLLTREEGYELHRPETLLVLVVRYAESFDAETITFAENAPEFISYDR